MLEVQRKKINRVFLFLLTVCLTGFLSHKSVASPSQSNISFLAPVHQLLLDDDYEFGSLIPGKLYSVAELRFWRARAKSGPHVVRADAYGTVPSGSLPDYALVLGSAQRFNDEPKSNIILNGVTRADLVEDGLTQQQLAEITFVGECAILNSGNFRTAIPSYGFGRMGLARDAAFVDLIENTSVNTSRVKSILLEQAQQPCMDFSNRDIYQVGVNNNSFWLYMEWLHTTLKAYDYLDDSVFTAAEKRLMDDWFKSAAQWSYAYVSAYLIEPIYQTRASSPINSVIDLNFWQHRPTFTASRQRYKGSTDFWPAGSFINNRHLGQLNYIVHAGVKYNNAAWKKEGAQIVKEYISFHFDENGYYAELNRATFTPGQALGPPLGISYGANTLVNISEIVHILYLGGYENLFEYKSKARINPDTGAIESGTVERSLEWVFLKFRENFMLNSSPAIYPLGLADNLEGSLTVIHFCKSTFHESMGKPKVVGRMYHPAVIVNRYYKNPLIKDMYNFSDDYGNICKYPDTDLEIRPGPHGILPATLFQYSDADEDY